MFDDLELDTMRYGMFSVEGNVAVHSLVLTAKALKLEWSQVYKALEALAEENSFAEATDTAVREHVYSACGFEY